MDWNAVGAIGEVVGALAVVISLLYVGTQIRHNTKTSRDEAFREICATINEQFNVLAAPDNTRCVLNGLRSYGDLNPEDKYRFDNLMMALVTTVESSIMSTDAELMPEETSGNWAYHLRTRYLGYSGMREWWEDAREIFDPSVRVWMDREFERTLAGTDYWRLEITPDKATESDT